MQVFKALSDETRYMMLKTLLEEDRGMCACEFEAYFDKDASVLFRNIKKLEDAGLVNTYKDGRKLFAEICDRDAVSNLVESVEALEPSLSDIAAENLQEA